ncbi:MAG: hypothetical protein SCABRO_02112 [Candidatus Scalindua brodae]|uniref:Uncharacterized protein n=1 Tax=Candidatus Scalindua brodae TaxID=237368 RepID=A0A0B0EGF1_9BACT|nr:MAG: hypothetical protein SCABRO_02112 [Candidatus Scalindua brodae]
MINFLFNSYEGLALVIYLPYILEKLNKMQEKVTASIYTNKAMVNRYHVSAPEFLQAAQRSLLHLQFRF